MSVRLAFSWGLATQVAGVLVMACSTSPSVGGGPGGGGSPGGQGGAAGQGGGGCADASADGCQAVGGSAGSGGNGGNGGNGGSVSTGGTGGTAGSGGSGGASQGPDLGYEPAGMGDPWFFTLQSDWSDYFKLDMEHGATASATWNPAGEVHVTANFAASGDNVKLHVTTPYDSVTSANRRFDLSQRMLRARVRVAPGASASGGLQLYSQSTSAWSWTNGEWLSFATLAGAEFQEVEFDLAESADPTQVIRIGMQLYGTGAGSVTFILDDLRLEPKASPPEVDAGSELEDAGPSDGDAGSPSPDGGLGYAPLGLGDPWLFTDSAEADAFATTENATKTWEHPASSASPATSARGRHCSCPSRRPRTLRRT